MYKHFAIVSLSVYERERERPLTLQLYNVVCDVKIICTHL